MTTLLAIDPGAAAGWARFETVGDKPARLTATGINVGFMATGIARVVIERPKIYPGGRQKARPVDIITLAVRAGEWGGLARAFWNVEPEYFEPSQWKGTTPKEVHHRLIWGRLDADERAVLSKCAEGVAMSKQHNMVDAVGIGLFALGRRA